MMRPYLFVAATLLAGLAPAHAGTCATQRVPVRGEVTACLRDNGCDVYLDPGGRTVAFCGDLPVDTTGVCTNVPRPWQACVLTAECTVFFTTGRPPGLCV